MEEPSLAAATRVLAAYPVPLRGTLEALGNHGGFSGARLWRLHVGGGVLCLRASAPTERRQHLLHRHWLMRLAREAGNRFVPRVLSTTAGDTVVEADCREWELMDWMPGRADFRETPTLGKLQTAARALARIHLAWEALGGEEVRPCPAVQRRLRFASGWLEWLGLNLRRPTRAPHEARLYDAVARWLPRVPEILRPTNFACRLQPCLRDVWREHLLFEGKELTGLVDFAGVGQDSVAADVARMFGSMVEDDYERWGVGLDAYREVRPFSPEEEQLARLLDRTGVIVALANWQCWLREPNRTFEDRERVNARIDELLFRVEKWQ